MHFLELERRSHNGEQLDKESWDVDRVVMGTAEIVEKYSLAWDKNDLCPVDDELCRRYYEAGRELLVNIGVYNSTTKRVIRFSEKEIDRAAANQRQSMIMGRGVDACTLYARKPEDTRKPLVFSGNPGCPTPEQYYKAYILSCVREPEIDLLTCGSLADVDGYPVRTGEASEVLAVRRELTYLNQAAQDAGRGGIGRLTAESAVSEIGDLAAFAEGFIQTGDSHLVALYNELITNKDNMVRAAASIHTGVLNSSLACVMIEGLPGGTPGSTVVMIASILAANIICRADYHLCHPIHLRYIATSTRECMWLQSVVCQAFYLCAPNIIVCDIYPKSGALTKELLYEVAANTLAITVSGGQLEGVGSCDGLLPHGTGLEARLMGAVGRFASQQAMSREEAGKIILKLLEKYEHVFPTGNPGVPFNVAYDVIKVEPVDEWQRMYDEVCNELIALGIQVY